MADFRKMLYAFALVALLVALTAPAKAEKMSLRFEALRSSAEVNTSIVIINPSMEKGNCTLNFLGDKALIPKKIVIEPSKAYAGVLSVWAPVFSGYLIAECDFRAYGLATINYFSGSPPIVYIATVDNP